MSPDSLPLLYYLGSNYRVAGQFDEAIDALDGTMLRNLPGVFCAGEMVAWDAPTGGYLLTACLASGRAAGGQAADYASGGLRIASART